jgi:flagellar M-ring protein FliF
MSFGKPKKSTVPLELLDSAKSYDDKLFLVKYLIEQDIPKAVAIVKKMIKEDIDKRGII